MTRAASRLDSSTIDPCRTTRKSAPSAAPRCCSQAVSQAAQAWPRTFPSAMPATQAWAASQFGTGSPFASSSWLTISKSGTPAATTCAAGAALSTGAAVLGHPAASLAALVNLLAEQGRALPAGTLVLTGAITEAFAVQAGDHVAVTAVGVGSASLRFE